MSSIRFPKQISVTIESENDRDRYVVEPRVAYCALGAGDKKQVGIYRLVEIHHVEAEVVVKHIEKVNTDF